MAKCEVCGQDMLTARSCALEAITFPDGLELAPIPYSFVDYGPDGTCHDCGTHAGMTHHSGCDMEQCPRCGGQLITCGCLDSDEDDDSILGYQEAPK